jgi:bifunctional diaminopimelate decarboxylase / aspartate kinase
VFEERKVHLVSQAANDLNLTFVLEAREAPRLVQQLHRSLIHRQAEDPVLGPTWEQLFEHEAPAVRPSPGWWLTRRDELIELGTRHGSAYVYHLPSVDEAISELAGLASVERVLYAVKANAHPSLLRRFEAAGFGFETVSPGEVGLVLEAFPDIDRRRILFTPNFAPREEYAWALAQGIWLTLDNLYPLRHWPELFAGAELFLRLDPGQGRGHHRHVRTAGSHSKFGIPLFELEEAAERITQLRAYRWTIEIVFRWLKRVLQLDELMSVSPKGVEMQVAVALIVYGVLLCSGDTVDDSGVISSAQQLPNIL